MDEDKQLCIFTNDIGEGAWNANGRCKYEWCESENLEEVENIIQKSLGE
jgi:hypothetical protein